MAHLIQQQPTVVLTHLITLEGVANQHQHSFVTRLSHHALLVQVGISAKYRSTYHLSITKGMHVWLASLTLDFSFQDQDQDTTSVVSRN